MMIDINLSRIDAIVSLPASVNIQLSYLFTRFCVSFPQALISSKVLLGVAISCLMNEQLSSMNHGLDL